MLLRLFLGVIGTLGSFRIWNAISARGRLSDRAVKWSRESRRKSTVFLNPHDNFRHKGKDPDLRFAFHNTLMSLQVGLHNIFFMGFNSGFPWDVLSQPTARPWSCVPKNVSQVLWLGAWQLHKIIRVLLKILAPRFIESPGRLMKAKQHWTCRYVGITF